MPAEVAQELSTCMETWKKFLLGVVSNPGKFEVHAIPIGWFGDITEEDVPNRWNRYISRDIEMDFVYSDGWSFVAHYCKIGPLAFFGHVRNNMTPWKGTRLSITHGLFNNKKTVLPRFLLNYFYSRAQYNAGMAASVSPKQRERTNQEVLKNIDRMRNSDLFVAMQADAERFGLSAITYPEE